MPGGDHTGPVAARHGKATACDSSPEEARLHDLHLGLHGRVHWIRIVDVTEVSGTHARGIRGRGRRCCRRCCAGGEEGRGAGKRRTLGVSLYCRAHGAKKAPSLRGGTDTTATCCPQCRARCPDELACFAAYCKSCKHRVDFTAVFASDHYLCITCVRCHSCCYQKRDAAVDAKP